MDSRLENKYTIIYKQVEQLNSPVRYITVIEDQYLSYESLVYNYTVDLEYLYNVFIGAVKLDEIIFAYYTFNLISRRDKETLFEDINSFIDRYNTVNVKDNAEWIDFKPFDSGTSLYEEATAWYKKYKAELARDVEKAKNIIQIQSKLLSLESQKIVNVEISEATFTFNPIIKFESEKVKRQRDITVNEKTGIMIFNDIKVSKIIPYIKLFNYDKEEYHKVYESDIFRNINKIIESRKFDRINYIYFLVLNNNDYRTIANTSYTTVEYDLVNNKLSFTCKIGKESDILRRLQEAFKGFQFTKTISSKSNIVASMIVPNFDFDPSVLHFIFFNEDIYFPLPIFSTYFFIDESDLTIADREDIRIKYRSLTDETDEDGMSSGATIALKAIKDNLVVEVTKGRSEEVIDDFIIIFSKVLTYYNEVKDVINQILEYAVPYEEVIEKKKKTKAKIEEDIYEKKLDQLRALSSDPEVFKSSSEGYSRRCNCQKQPIIIEAEEFEDWKNKTFTDRGEAKERQVGNFPPNSIGDPIFNYVCPDDDFPYPTVVPSSAELYPHVPCCSKTDSINNPKSDYNNYGLVKESSTSNKSYKIKTYKYLEWGRTAELNNTVENLLNSNVQDQDKTRYERIGVGRSLNSLIHCVLRAVADKKYLSLQTDEAREKYCIEFRKSIPEKLPNYKEIVKQEMFNDSNEVIEEFIMDNNKFFDSSKFYRILEELYRVNIYVFEPYGTPSIEIPSHALVHIRPFHPRRNTILLTKYTGSDTEKLDFTIYDIIINTNNKIGKVLDETIPRTFLHDKRITELAYNSFMFYNENFVLNIENKSIETRLRPYSMINWDVIFKSFKLVEQDLDAYGKLRSINIEVPNSDIKLTVFVPPGQPLNCPRSSIINVVNKETVISIFGAPKKVINGGYWYSILDIDTAIFIPCDVESKNTEPISPVLEQIIETDNPIYTYRKIQKESKLLLDFIIWGLRSNGILNLVDFRDRYNLYIKSDTKVSKNASPKKLVSYLTENGNFSYINSIWPAYFYTDNTVHLYPSLYDKVIKYLDRYYTETHGLNLVPVPYIKDVFQFEWDFTKIPENRILIGNTHLKTWLDIHSKNFKGDLEIQTKIKHEILKTTEPFIYFDKDKKRMYLIQTVRDGLLDRALSCAEEWRIKKINPGYETPKNLHSDVFYAIFNISTSHDVFPNGEYYIEGDSTEYNCILEYNGNYIAMLDIF
jgi:hypothetical protein